MGRRKAATQQPGKGSESGRRSVGESEGAGREVREIGSGEGSGRGGHEIGRGGEVWATANSGQVDKTQRAAGGRSALLGERDRDRELVRWIGCQGAVSISHVMAALGVGRTAAYRRVGVLVEAGLLERLALLRSAPTILRASAAGLRYAGLGMSAAKVSPAAVDHSLRCASTVLLLAGEFGSSAVLSERELALAERIEGRPLASARVGGEGRARLHRPDLAVIRDGQVIAVEVELSAKAPRRLEAIMRGWRRASWVDRVRYYCEPGQARRGVERAVATTHSAEQVFVFEAVAR